MRWVCSEIWVIKFLASEDREINDEKSAPERESNSENKSTDEENLYIHVFIAGELTYHV